MRYQIGQKIIAFAAIYDVSVDDGKLIRHNFLVMRSKQEAENGVQQLGVKFIELTVTEHHKVNWEHDEASTPPQCDGYILTDANGVEYVNQYPMATYGQVDTSADHHFSRRFASSEEMVNANKNGVVWRFRMLDHLLDLSTFSQDVLDGNAQPAPNENPWHEFMDKEIIWVLENFRKEFGERYVVMQKILHSDVDSIIRQIVVIPKEDVHKVKAHNMDITAPRTAEGLDDSHYLAMRAASQAE